MWLLPFFSHVSTAAVRLFYRMTVSGGPVPASGPALLVANHPNSLLDPAMVVSAAGRPVRFLAKSTLFGDAKVGWLVKGAGSIPVYRRQDDASQMDRNADAFDAVHEALAGGSAVGIFPEGTSHSGPALVPLKTGAARIALGGARLLGRALPVVPVGLVLREKQTFRTEALALIGAPVAWDDLALRGPEDADAVRELTARIDAALHAVTVNLERWEDRPLVETAEAVYAAERPVTPGPAARVGRLREATEGLARLRASDPAAFGELAREVAAHARVLRVLGLRPEEVKVAPRTAAALSWTARNLAFFALGAPVAALGAVLYAIPYRLTGIAEARARPERDIRATYKVLFGGVLHLAWTALLVAAAGVAGGWIAAGAAALALPVVGTTTIHVADRWRRAAGEARRFLLRTRRPDVLAELRARQAALADALDARWRALRAPEPARIVHDRS